MKHARSSTESQGWGSKVPHHKVIDAGLGVIEGGTWTVADAVKGQPWLPNGPIPTKVSWRRTPKGAPPQAAAHRNGQQPALA